MFLKESNKGFSYLEQFAESALQLKNFIDYLKTKLGLSEDSDLVAIQEKVSDLIAESMAKTQSTWDLEEVVLQLRKQNSRLLASLTEERLTANISSYMLYEALEFVKSLLDNRKDFIDDSDYLNHLVASLSKLKNNEILQPSDVVTVQYDEISRLKTTLEAKIEAYSHLKLQVAELFSRGCAPDLSNFERDFGKFIKEISLIKEKANKYNFLIDKGVIKEVDSNISGTGNFYLHYGK